MQIEKYRYLLYEKIQEKITRWSEQEKQITSAELLHFLNSIQKAAKSLQMLELLHMTTDLIKTINMIVEKTWAKDELKELLSDFVRLKYVNELSPFFPLPNSHTRENNVPLIQLIDEELSSILPVKRELENKGWMVIANSDPDKAISIYFDSQPDCLIMDIDYAKKNYIHTEIQNHNNQKFVPKIVISKNNDRQTRMDAYKNGADSFISKPIDIEELLVKLERHLSRKKIYDQSVLMDELTQVYNRRYLLKALEKNLKELKRTNIPFTIALLDIDHFTFLNRKNGHQIGDHILVQLATFLNEQLRVRDTLYRLSGSQFIIEFPGTEVSDIKDVISRLLSDFSKKVFEVDERKFSVTFSTGIYQVGQSELSPSTVLQQADQALKQAKLKGIAQIEVMKATSTPIQKTKLYVSVIDNDAIIRAMLVKILSTLTLEQYELDVQSFEDGVTFFETNRLEERGEHFLIIEGVMPIMSGLEILQKVKLHKNKQRIRVFMLTGKKSEQEIARALKLGADDYMTKPFSITELKARIERLIQRMM
jgi:diguanylate cyclase (GGDEF)-like protein